MTPEKRKSGYLATLLISTLLMLSQIMVSHDSLEEHESDSGFSDSNGNQTIQGQSFLNFTNSISHSSQGLQTELAVNGGGRRVEI